MKRRHGFSPAEAIKSVIIFILIVLMLVLMLLLMIGQNGSREEPLPQADRMMVYASGAQPMFAAGMDTARVSPYLLAYRRGGAALQIVHASESVGKPYEELYPLLRDLFGARAVGYTPDSDTASRLWCACPDMDSYIYVRYVGELPVSVIRAYTYSAEDSETTAATLDERVQGAASYIKELYLLPMQALQAFPGLLPLSALQETDAVCAVTCDDAGAVTLYRLSGSAQAADSTAVGDTDDTEADSTDALALLREDAAAESDIGLLDTYLDAMEALSADTQTGALLPCVSRFGTAVRLDGIYRMPQITLTPFDPASALYADPGKQTAILGLLGLRERDTDNYYTDGTGDRIYLNASGRLTVSGETAVIRYDALQEGGLDLADYLGYASIGGDYLLSEYLRASDMLLSGLEALESAFGGDALVCTLIDVKTISGGTEDTLVLTYGYTLCGIPLLDASGEICPAMVVHACGGVISHLELYPCHASISPEPQYLLPQSVAQEAMLLELGQPEDLTEPLCLYMAYRCDDAEDGCVHRADWIGLLP